MSVLIIVPVFNRKKITELSLKQTYTHKGDGNKLIVYNDYSTEYDNTFLEPYCDEVITMPTKMGVQHLRWYHLRSFLEQDQFEYLYLTDNDVIHDPEYINKLKELYGKYMLKDNKKMPVCLYNTKFHLNQGNVLAHKDDITIRKTAPGVSMFFDKDMVKVIVEKLNKFPGGDPDYAWDYRSLEMLGLPWITPNTSYLEHFGASGLHSVEGRIGMEKDRAINPTEYLQSIREPVIDYVLNEGNVPIL